MSTHPAWQQHLDFFDRPLVVEPSRAALTSDAGLLPLRQFDEQIGLTRAFAAVLDDPRDPALTEHTFLEMVRCRVYGILAAYEDQNGHDTFRHDPVFKLVSGRPPNGDDLASQPTLSRFENAINIASLKRLREGQPCTWRTLLVKVAAEVSSSTRRVVVRLSGTWPISITSAPPARGSLPRRRSRSRSDDPRTTRPDRGGKGVVRAAPRQRGSAVPFLRLTGHGARTPELR